MTFDSARIFNVNQLPGSSAFIATFLVLVAFTFMLLVDDVWSHKQQDERAERMQRMVGGLGFGPAVDLSTCPFTFDPRLASRCAQNHWPIPAGGCFCAQHSCSVFYYPPLKIYSSSISTGN